MATNNDAACDDPLSLVCKLCEKPYQHKDGPLLLPCLHSFCKPCLTEYVKKAPAADSRGKMDRCPTCNDLFPHAKDIDQLPINLRLSHLAETANMRGNKSKKENMELVKHAFMNLPMLPQPFATIAVSFYCAKCKEISSKVQSFSKKNEHEMIEIANFKKEQFKFDLPPCQMSNSTKNRS